MKNLEKAFGLSPADLAANEALDKRVDQARQKWVDDYAETARKDFERRIYDECAREDAADEGGDHV